VEGGNRRIGEKNESSRRKWPPAKTKPSSILRVYSGMKRALRR
jgi:hypothetical protein